MEKIDKAIAEFEESKNNANTMRDVLFLEAVILVLQRIKNEA